MPHARQTKPTSLERLGGVLIAVNDGLPGCKNSHDQISPANGWRAEKGKDRRELTLSESHKEAHRIE